VEPISIGRARCQANFIRCQGRISLPGSAYVTGSSSSPDLPLQNAVRAYGRNGDAFVAQFDSAGAHLILSTYLGGSGPDNGTAVAVNVSAIYVAGNTSSTDLGATSGAFQTALRGSYDAFIVRIFGGTIVNCTYLGGSGSDSASGIAFDGSGNVYVSGYTFSSDFPRASELQTYGGRQDAFVAEFDRGLSGLLWSTYLGGSETTSPRVSQWTPGRISAWSGRRRRPTFLSGPDLRTIGSPLGC
jgi:beta-propeller repeat-containing protein